MPHCVIEHFAACPTPVEREEAMCLALSVCAGSNIMALADIKVRCIEDDAILFGDGRRSFVHITVSMLAGRSDEGKDQLSRALRDAFRGRYPAVESISVDIRDMNPACYRKDLG